MKLRLMPLLIFTLMLSLSLKLIAVISYFPYKDEVYNPSIRINSFFIEEASASEEKKAPAEGEHKKADEVVIDRKFLDLTCNPVLSKFNMEEIKLLENLATRRDEIEKKNEEILYKEKLLMATEAELNKKIENLKNLKAEIEGLMTSYNKEESQRIKSLVKIYETMKPQEAADIFNDLDMNVLLQVINNMKETKVAPIFSKMNRAKAREISIEFANQKKLTPLP